MPEVMQFEEGKYTLYLHEDGRITTQRYREPWPPADKQFVGDSFLHLIVERLFQHRTDLERLRRLHEVATENNAKLRIALEQISHAYPGGVAEHARMYDALLRIDEIAQEALR